MLLAETCLVAVERSGQPGQRGHHVTVLAHALRALPPVAEQMEQAEPEGAPVRKVRADAREDDALAPAS